MQLPRLRPHQWTFQVLRLHLRLRRHNQQLSQRQVFKSLRQLFLQLLHRHLELLLLQVFHGLITWSGLRMIRLPRLLLRFRHLSLALLQVKV